MFFAILTLLSALTVAGVSGWFSIVGVMSIYAGAPLHAALVMGLVLEGAKLVTISWLYRNWQYATWVLKLPLIYFMVALMVATSIGVFGFLTKAHLEQGAATIDNTAKIERLDQQIAREKAVIADNEKVILQLDTAINSFLGNDKTDRALAVRRAQAPQRKQLRDEIQAAQKQIDVYSEEKLKLTSEVRALQLEVGPIRYIADLFYSGSGSDTAKIETAVRIFTLLIVSTLDPLAVILLIAANHTILRLKNEKEIAEESQGKNSSTEASNNNQEETKTSRKQVEEEEHTNSPTVDNAGSVFLEIAQVDAKDNAAPIAENTPNLNFDDVQEIKDFSLASKEIAKRLDNNESLDGMPDVSYVVSDDNVTDNSTDTETETATEITNLEHTTQEIPSISGINLAEAPEPAHVEIVMDGGNLDVVRPNSQQPWAHNEAVLAEILGSQPHFVPIRINEKAEFRPLESTTNSSVIGPATEIAPQSVKTETETVEQEGQRHISEEGDFNSEEISPGITSASSATTGPDATNKYPKALSWLKEFRGN